MLNIVVDKMYTRSPLRAQVRHLFKFYFVHFH